jgi:uncharacterized protein YuzB (UPF0349 family)
MKHTRTELSQKITNHDLYTHRKDKTLDVFKKLCNAHGGAVQSGKYTLVDTDVYEVRLK